MEIRVEKDRVFVEMVEFDSLAQKAGIDFDWEILSVQLSVERPAKQWMYLPALLMLGFIIYLQRARSSGRKN